MTWAFRHIEKFESFSGAISYTFPLNSYEWESSQGIRTPMSIGVGANYPYDHLGVGMAPVNAGSEHLRFILTGGTAASRQTALTDLRSKLRRIGRGWLYLVEADGTTRYRAHARLQGGLPEYQITGRFRANNIPITLDFQRLSDWQATTPTTGSQLIDTPFESVTVSNPGDLPVYAVTWRLRNTSAALSIRPMIHNITTGQYAAFARSMSAAPQELYLNSGSREVKWSESDGVGYTNIYSLFGGEFFRLDPGNNTLRLVAGRAAHPLWFERLIADPDFTLEWSFYPNYSN